MTDTDYTIEQGLARQEERINRLFNAVSGLEEALFQVLAPAMDEDATTTVGDDVPLMAPVMVKLNINNDRIHGLYSRIFNMTDRLAVGKTLEKEEGSMTCGPRDAGLDG